MGARSLLLVLFILLEIALFVELGKEVDTAQVLIEVIGSALLGWLILRTTTQNTGLRARAFFWTMELPAKNLLKGFMSIIGGILLVIPGLLSDILGLILVLPPTQMLVVAHFKNLYPKVFKH